MEKKDYLLQKVGQEAWRKHRILEKDDSSVDYRDALKRLYERRDLNEEHRLVIRKMMESPKLHEMHENVNQAEAKKAEEYAERQVKELIARGLIPPPDHDEWAKNRGLY